MNKINPLNRQLVPFSQLLKKTNTDTVKKDTGDSSRDAVVISGEGMKKHILSQVMATLNDQEGAKK